jgi:hypothetical protein
MILISIVAPSASMMLGLHPLSLKRASIACSKDGNSIIAVVFEMPASKIAVRSPKSTGLQLPFETAT